MTVEIKPNAKPVVLAANSTLANKSEAFPNGFDPESLIPNDAVEPDRATMRVWYQQNDLCRGSSDLATINTICPKRDQSEVILQKRGWCWAYDDDTVFPPDYKWHRCSENTLALARRTVLSDVVSENYDDAPDGTRNITDELEASATGVAAGGTETNQRAFKASQLAASPALRNFEAMIKARNIDLSTAEVVVSCGLRPKAWKERIRARIAKSFSTDAAETAAKAALTEDEHEVSKAYIGGVMAAHEQFLLGDHKQAGCRMIADAPFLSAFDDYAANVSNTLPSGAETRRVAVSSPSDILTPAKAVKSARGTALHERIRDARAMVQESWDASGLAITSITIGYGCNIYDRLSANIAIQRIQNSMQDELNHAGLINDATMNIAGATNSYVITGKMVVRNGACSRMTPAVRGRLRSMVQL